MFFKTLLLSFIALSIALTAGAQTSVPTNSVSAVISAYRFYKDVGNIAISVPTVVEMPFVDEFIERFDFVVLDKSTNSFEPLFFKQETLLSEIPVVISTSPNNANTNWINDGKTNTYADFYLPDDAQGSVQITITSATPIISSSLTALLGDNVALPTSVEMRAIVAGQNRIIVAERKMDQQTIRFPQTTSSNWTINFTFGQPLRISELRLNQDLIAKSSTRSIRWLAQPNHDYRIYFDPDRAVTAPIGEAGNLTSATDVLALPAVSLQNNPDYVIADIDNDQIPDINDNCLRIANSDQQDVNHNGRGDVCDDFDQDGLININDNCPDNPNRSQKDTDSDGIGDVCDTEESRITERHAWIPWVGIGFAALVIIILLVLTAKSIKTSKDNDN